jgi:hypothetical protein
MIKGQQISNHGFLKFLQILMSTAISSYSSRPQPVTVFHFHHHIMNPYPLPSRRILHIRSKRRALSTKLAKAIHPVHPLVINQPTPFLSGIKETTMLKKEKRVLQMRAPTS